MAQKELDAFLDMGTKAVLFGHITGNAAQVETSWKTICSLPNFERMFANVVFRAGCQLGNISVVQDAEKHGATLKSANEQIGGGCNKCLTEAQRLGHFELVAYLNSKYNQRP